MVARKANAFLALSDIVFQSRPKGSDPDVPFRFARPDGLPTDYEYFDDAYAGYEPDIVWNAADAPHRADDGDGGWALLSLASLLTKDPRLQFALKIITVINDKEQ